MKKILTILLTIISLLALTACNQKETSIETKDPTIVEATTGIAYNGDTKQLEVTSVILHVDDVYYGVEVNDAVNFNNSNNYFTTSKGLTIALLQDAEAGINMEGEYASIQELEDGIYLMIKGEKELVEETFNHVFKANSEVYQMFKHDINPDWTKEVVITNDVISFSNGEDTTYIYQNPGSLSPGCYQGRIEPTVFYKQLRGIDIPITYPEKQEIKEDTYFERGYDAGAQREYEEYYTRELEYTAYGPVLYDHESVEGYTPYSAYDLSDLIQIGIKPREAVNDVYNYIILANNDNNVLNLFNNINKRYHNYISININSNTVELPIVDTETYNLSSFVTLASNIINSENRYHFGIVQADDKNQTGETYYIDAPDNDITRQTLVRNNMFGKLIIPTMKVGEPILEGSYQTLHETNYGADSDWMGSRPEIGNHGAEGQFQNYLYGKIGEMVTAYNGGHDFHEYIFEGDYIYQFYKDYSLKIYKNIGTTESINIKEQLAMFKKLKSHDISTNSCSMAGSGALTQYYNLISHIQY